MSSILLSLSFSIFAAAQALASPMHDCIERSCSVIMSIGAEICNRRSSAYESGMIVYETIMANNLLKRHYDYAYD